MKVCLIAKYPPIEGGESSKTYWMARGLGRRGCDVHIVTNAWEVEDEYRESITVSDLNSHYQPHSVFVHNTDPFSDPSYIPYSKPYTEKISGLAIDVIRQFDVDIVDSWYLLPYAVSGFMASSITGKPQIVRHAGSDITRLFNSPMMNSLFVEIFRRSRIVTYPGDKALFDDLGIDDSCIHLNRLVSVDTSVFTPEAEALDMREFFGPDFDNEPVITYAGKVGVTKGVYELVEAFANLREKARLLFVCGGAGAKRLHEVICQKGLNSRIAFRSFLPPWKMPSVFRASICVVVPERDFPVAQHTPILPREVLATGSCLVLSREIYDKLRFLGINENQHALVVDPKKIGEFTEVIRTVLNDGAQRLELGRQGRALSERVERFEDYIDDMLGLYKKMLG
jgi:glycosyltransferase involved in cell wall biosynthesis